MNWTRFIICLIIVFILMHVIIAFVGWDSFLDMSTWDAIYRLFFLYGWICGTILSYTFTGWIK